jgi:enoyl-CoA hydratase
MSDASEILVAKGEDGVAVVTLNRPEAMNALSSNLRRAFAEAMDDIARDESVRAVVLTGAGTRAFSAGVDMKEMGSDPSVLNSVDPLDATSNPVAALERIGKPVVGAINGVAVTGGLELALGCTMLVASSTARFADTHALVGLLPIWGASAKLSRIIGLGRAKEMSLTGKFIDAATANDWGLVNRVVEPDALLAEAHALAARMAQIDGSLLRAYSRLIDDGYDLPFGQALEHEQQVAVPHNLSVRSDDLAARREGVVKRGQSQVSS